MLMDEDKKVEVWNMDSPSDGIKDISPADDFDPRRAASAGYNSMGNALAKAVAEDEEYKEESQNAGNAVGWASATEYTVLSNTKGNNSVDAAVASGVGYLILWVVKMWFMPFSGRVRTNNEKRTYTFLSWLLWGTRVAVTVFAGIAAANALL